MKRLLPALLPALLLLIPMSALAEAIPAKDSEAIKKLVGQEATVTGVVQNVNTSPSGSITFINFKGNQRTDFTGIIKKENKEAVDKGFDGDTAKALKGKTIELTGTVTEYQSKLQIEVTKPEQIKIVAAAATEPKKEAEPKKEEK